MSDTDSVSVTTVVAVDADTAFSVFTDDIDLWWRRGPGHQFRPGADGAMRFDPGPEGRLVQVFDARGEDVYEVGRVLVWEPGKRLAFEFHGFNYEPDQMTQVEVRFEPVDAGTRVTLEHRGWDSLPQDHPARHGLDSAAFASTIGVFWADLLVRVRTRASHRDAEGG
jgi:uncharacterized protein YndB with AHSA1/START domain